MNLSELKEAVRSHLSDGEIETSLNILIEHLRTFDHEDDLDDALRLRANFSKAKKDHELRRTTSRAEYELEINKAISGIQTILKSLGQPAQRPTYLQQNKKEGKENRTWLWAVLTAVGIAVAGFAVWQVFGDSKPDQEQAVKSPTLAPITSSKTKASVNADSLMQIAQKAYDKKNYTAAIAALDFLLQHHPDNKEATTLRQTCQDAKAQVENATRNKAAEKAEQKRLITAADADFNASDIRAALSKYEQANHPRADICRKIIAGGSGTYLLQSVAPGQVIPKSSMRYFNIGGNSSDNFTKYDCVKAAPSGSFSAGTKLTIKNITRC